MLATVIAASLVSCNDSGKADAHSVDSDLKAAADTIKASVDTAIRKIDSRIRAGADTVTKKILSAEDSLKRKLSK